MSAKITKYTLILIACLSMSSMCLASDYYVKNSGNDGNNGLSDATAWKTLNYACSRISSNDTLYLKRGNTWTGSSEGGGENGLIYINNKSNITIDAYATGNNPIIDRTSQRDPVPDSLYPDYTCVEIRGTSTGNTIKNLDLRGAKCTACIYIYAGSVNTIENCRVRGSGWTKKDGCPSAESLCCLRTKVVFDGCYFDQITGNSYGYSKSIEFRYADYAEIKRCTFKGYSMGGAVRFSNGADNGVIDNNYFYYPDPRDDNYAWAIVVRSQDGGTCQIINNVIDMTHNGSLSGSNLRGMAFWDDHGPVTRKMFNNTIISDGSGYGIHGTGSTNLGYNNIFYNLQAGWNNIGNNTTLKNNIFYSCDQKYNDGSPSESGTLVTNPSPINPSMSNHVAADAMIESQSAAIDRGTSSDPNIPTNDYAGTIRPQGSAIDIGAFEYGGNPGDTTPPDPPTGLRLD